MKRMIPLISLSCCIALLAFSLSRAIAADPAKSDFLVVGYLPDYRVEQIDPEITANLTDLVFFSVKAEPQGKFASKSIDAPQTKALLKTVREKYHVRTHLCVGGWERSQGFAEIAATEPSRQGFADGLTAYCTANGFDGADIDWEHPIDATEAKNYGLLLATIERTFKPSGLTLTAAMAGWQTLTPEGIAALDGLNLMSYDANGKHSTMELAQSDVKKLRDAGVPANKIRLGVPFYGRSIQQRGQTKTYAELVKASTKPIDSDEIDGIYFNGPNTIRAKTRYAKEQGLSGVMIWEIGQDAPGNASLLKVIHDEAK